ncbi:hypothetical protein SAMN02745194_01646 [Roseomonas rosea]|uniref:SGNH/GDSL hydrolase family protein n=1 Tax=Muricoccus roseus TaxID=198092 RepID=A0A1M6G7Y5_9PROT|nr:hypothetical protein [Roseomonas rosea]SHJ06029.1 hypothetical protein SAMN02745194_01646 [Roseomonas rosea]
MEVVILGDSHSVALGRGLAQLARRGPLPCAASAVKLCSSPRLLQPFFAREPDGIRLTDPEAAQALTQLNGTPVLDASRPGRVYAFVMGFTIQPFTRDPSWRRHAPWQEARQGEIPLSTGMIRAAYLHHARHILEFLRAVAALGVPAVVVSGPPVRADDIAITRNIMRPEVALRIDAMVRETMTETLAGIGLPAVLPPAEAFEDGWLREELREGGRDFHHANALYGEAMVPLILQAGMKQEARVSETLTKRPD